MLTPYESDGWVIGERQHSQMVPVYTQEVHPVKRSGVPVKVLHSDRNGDRIEGLSSGRLEG